MIKRVKIVGFMSIKSENWYNLNPGHNVIAGPNGSGKSTYLRAIRFVLTNDFPCTTSAEKLTILNDSKTYARVDILVDNEDNRFQTFAESQCFSRQLDMKKDTYFINNTRISKSEFMKILQKANFSIKRPIYILPQGEASRLVLISNEERLQILEEVSGFREFKEQENLINKRESGHKKLINIITEALENFDGQLAGLNVDVAELQQCQQLKKKADTIETIIANRKLEKTQKDLGDCEKKGNKSRETRNSLRNDLDEMEEKERELLNAINNLKGVVQNLEKKKRKNIVQKKSAANKKIELEYECDNLQKELEMIEDQEKDSEGALIKMNDHIKKAENDLLTIIPMYEKEVKELEELENLKKEWVLKDLEVAEVYARKARARQFSTMLEKDKWIENEVSKLQNEMKESQSDVKKLDSQIKMKEDGKSKLAEEIQTLEKHIEQQNNAIELDNKKLEDLNEEKNKSSDKLSNRRDEQNETEKILSEKQSEIAQVDKKFRKSVSKKILNGIESVKKVLEVFSERKESTHGYFGLLIDLFGIKTGKEEVELAVENAAGNNLFYFVVATDELATRIVEEMNKLDLPGEANFLPLDRLRSLELESIPKDSFCIMSFLNYEPEHDAVIRSVFGRKLICRDLDSAYEYAKRYKVECLTLDGGQVFVNGNVIGGYQEVSKSRFHIYKEKEKLEMIAESVQKRLTNIQDKIKEESENKIDIENRISKIDGKLKLAKDKYAKMKIDLKTKKLELTSSLESLSLARKMKALQESKLEILQSKISNLENDLNQELSSQLTEEEDIRLFHLLKDINDFRKKMQKTEKTVASLRVKKEYAESFLNERRKEAEQCEKEKEYFISRQEVLKKDIQIRKSNILNLETQPGLEPECQLTNIDEEVDNETKKEQSLAKELEKLVQDKDKLEKELKKCDSQIAKIDPKIKQLEVERSQLKEIIRSLSFTESLAKNFEKSPTLDLLKSLTKLKTKIHKMKVNPRANDLLTKINSFKEPFMRELKKIELSENFDKFMSQSEQVAKECLEEEFTELSRNFNMYFKKFVPNGRGELRKCRADQVEDETFTGIDVAVYFPGQGMKNLNSLSGGEKSIVSLAFIFANSINNPPPFFIFDEVDAALSGTNVELLAGIINEIKTRTQVITSTFNRRIMEEGDKLYKVVTINGVSHIQTVDSVEQILA